ncbi:MAG TPA: M20/M25/M40 family metallo-hydrolase, partial [Gemmatimonadaceae bacterium]|nr:M20/M25/M40 family metallo-hydrolase [Gemmatimonadaceae bacterium]
MTKLFAGIALGAVALSAAPIAAQTRPVAWDALASEGTTILSEYLRVNTTNPPGNELAAARFLKAILDREGIEAQILDTLELGPNRANLYARLRGNGAKKAIALVHHMDVVPATPASWSVDPFSGAIKDGYIWGRGTLDMKGSGIAQLMALIAIKRSGVPLTRDIVYVGNADEELTSTGGLAMVSRHADLLKDVEYLITEGGDNLLENGKIVYFAVGVAEKRTFWQRLTVHGVPSHGSRPTKLNPVPRLVAALYRISQFETPLHVTPGVDKFFRDISRIYPEPQRRWLSDVTAALNDPKERQWILSDVSWNAFLRNTISLTGLVGSNKTNVIPGVATADIDVRLLPDQDAGEFLKTLQGVVGDTAVHFTTLLAPKTPLESPIETDLFRAIERAAHEREPAAFVTTPMETAAT